MYYSYVCKVTTTSFERADENVWAITNLPVKLLIDHQGSHLGWSDTPNLTTRTITLARRTKVG